MSAPTTKAMTETQKAQTLSYEGGGKVSVSVKSIIESPNFKCQVAGINKIREQIMETQKAQTIGQAAYEGFLDADLPLKSWWLLTESLQGKWEIFALAAVKHALAQLAPKYKLVARDYPDVIVNLAAWQALIDASPEVNIEEALKEQK